MSQNTRQVLDRAIKTVGFLMAVGAFLWGVGVFLVPLRTVPSDMRTVQNQLAEFSAVQRVQTESIRTLAEVAKEQAETRRDFDATSATLKATDREHDYKILAIEKRLDKIEKMP